VPLVRLELDDDVLGAQRGRFRGHRRAARQHRERTAVKNVLGAEPHAERLVPAQLISLVRGDTQAPRAARRGAAQAALDGPAAPFQQIAADRQHDGGENDEQEEGGEEPNGV
jgi:hypothetical protein